MNDNINKLRSLFFDEADSLFAIFDKELYFLDANEVFFKTLHLKKEDMPKKHISEIPFYNQTNGQHDRYVEVIKTGETLIIDDVKTQPSLGNLYMRIKAFRLDGGLGTIASNITDLKQAAEHFEILAYKTAHDMRAPLTNILGLIEIIEGEITNTIAVNEYLTMMKKQVEKLSAKIITQINETKKQNT
jgi:signal transduction histidine kinase